MPQWRRDGSSAYYWHSGNATTAVLIGDLVINDLRPGSELFAKHPDIVFNLYISMFVVNAIIVVVGIFGSRARVNVTRLEKR